VNAAEPAVPSPLFARRCAVLLMVALVAGLTLITAFSIVDRSQRQTLEDFQQVTAAGDTAYVPQPRKLENPPQVLAHYDGRALSLVSAEKVKLHDTAMVRVGRDEAAGVFIYTTREPRADEEGFFYLKIDTGEYLKTHVGEALAPE
jgi:hypothetical protein